MPWLSRRVPGEPPPGGARGRVVGAATVGRREASGAERWSRFGATLVPNLWITQESGRTPLWIAHRRGIADRRDHALSGGAELARSKGPLIDANGALDAVWRRATR